MGVYFDVYTAEYPVSGSLPETGYLAPTVVSALGGATVEDDAEVLGNRWRDRSPGDELWRRKRLSRTPTTFAKRNGAWSAHVGFVPAVADRVIRGGYEEPVTLTELDELLAAGLISSDDRNAAIIAAGYTP